MTKIENKPISSDFPYEKKYIEIDGNKIAYVDEGKGENVLFLHGNPTSSYIWRNIIPYVTDSYRAIAMDLIGMGDSDKPDITYDFEAHAYYVDEFIKKLELKNIILVIHDWGTALGMRYARLNEENVKAMAFMEAVIPPAMPASDYDSLGEETGELFRTLHTEGVGEELVLKNNFFVEVVLGQMAVIRDLTEEEMNHYREPFKTEQSRIPTLSWPRQMPIDGKPKNTVDAVEKNGEWFYNSNIPKLYFYAKPGALNTSKDVEYILNNAPNIKGINTGAGVHYLQEDNPHLIGEELYKWLTNIE